MIEFDKSWENWVRSNLSNLVPTKKLIDRMIESGFDSELSKTTVARISAEGEKSEVAKNNVMNDVRGYLDQSPMDVRYHMEIPAFLDKMEIDRILGAVQDSDLKEGKIGGGTLDISIRHNKVVWLDLKNFDRNIHDKLQDAINDTNKNFFRFNIFDYVGKNIQITRYDKDSHYDYHLDFGGGENRYRKLTSIIQLSDSSSYVGGDLELKYGVRPVMAPRGQGTLFIFPSFLLHKVTKLESGRRVSIVNWSMGAPYC